MRAGRMDRSCRFERRVAAADIYGNVHSGAWETVTAVAGWLRLGAGREGQEGGRTEAGLDARLEVRASAAVRAVTEADRVVIDSVAWSIRSIAEPPRRGRIEFAIERGAGT